MNKWDVYEPWIILSFDVRGLLEFPIDFKRATERREGNPLDEADFLEESRFGDLRADIDHGTCWAIWKKK